MTGPDRAAARVGGVLVERDGCLFLRAIVREELAIWDAVYSYSDGALLDSSGQVVVRVGERLSGGGGHYSGYATIEDDLGEPIPERCRLDGEPFVTVHSVQRVPPP